MQYMNERHPVAKAGDPGHLGSLPQVSRPSDLLHLFWALEASAGFVRHPALEAIVSLASDLEFTRVSVCGHLGPSPARLTPGPPLLPARCRARSSPS